MTGKVCAKNFDPQPNDFLGGPKGPSPNKMRQIKHNRFVFQWFDIRNVAAPLLAICIVTY